MRLSGRQHLAGQDQINLAGEQVDVCPSVQAGHFDHTDHTEGTEVQEGFQIRVGQVYIGPCMAGKGQR